MECLISVRIQDRLGQPGAEEMVEPGNLGNITHPHLVDIVVEGELGAKRNENFFDGAGQFQGLVMCVQK